MCTFWEKLRGLKKVNPHSPRNYIIRPTPPRIFWNILDRIAARTALVWPAARTTQQQIKNPARGGLRIAGPRGLLAETRTRAGP